MINREKLADRLPWSTPQPADASRRTSARAMRVAGFVLVAVVLALVVLQFQNGTVRNLRKAEKYDRLVAAGELSADVERPKEHKGAIGRWRFAVGQFWQGKNIYRRSPVPQSDVPSMPSAGPVKRTACLHPNMPFVVILLSPFALLDAPTAALAWNVLKVLVVAATLLMAARVCNDGQKRMPDWVVLLGLLWALLLIVGDFQHGNTNVFVLGAIVLHLWLYRRGCDLAAGAALALAICLKMTPALFVVYWLYQRNWRLLAGAAGAMVLLAVAIPMVVMTVSFGASHWWLLNESWLRNLIVPGLVKGAWYPVHVNQSLSGVLSRYFLDAPTPGGNVFWNPDDNAYAGQTQFAWIAIADLPPAAVKAILRLGQAAVVGLLAWAIGWRKLPRDDGRRALHYGLVVVAMLLLNQRTWSHHAGILLVADLAIWYAIAFGVVSRRVRAWAMGLMLAAGATIWLTRTGMFKLAAHVLGRDGERISGEAWVWGTRVAVEEPMRLASVWGDMAKAYGPTFVHFVLVGAAAVVLAAGMRKASAPYADRRQKLLAANGG